MFDIAVAGGGMAGAALASALAREQASIALIEQRPASGERQRGKDARGIALSLSSRRILDEIGLWPGLESYTSPIERVHVSTKGRYGCARLSAAELGLRALGYVAPAHELGRALFQQLAGRDNISMFCPAVADRIERETGAVALRVRQGGEQTVLRCRLLVIADGAFSTLREQAGIEARVRDYQQTAIVSNVSVSRAHADTAYERFIPGGLSAMLPLRDEFRCATVLVAATGQADACLHMDDDAWLSCLQQAFGKRLGQLSAPGPRQSWPLHLVQPRQQVAERVALLGNAAHTIHPNGAQGLNLTLRDVAGLVARLRTALQDGGDVGAPEVLNAYASSRQADQRRVVRFTDVLQRTAIHARPLTAVLRDSALLTLDALPGLKKEFVMHATGLRISGQSDADRIQQKPERTLTPARTRTAASGVADTELLIIGGGLIGNTLALLAASVGIDCILVERSSLPATAAPQQEHQQDIRMLALTPASRNILSRAQTWQQLAQQDIGLFRQMQVWDENGSGKLFFDSAAIGQSTLGYIVPQARLAHAQQAARKELPDIVVCTGVAPTACAHNGNAVTVTLSDGQALSARLLVAADGAQSALRRLAGIEYPVRDYRQTAVAAIIQTELEHGQVARQRFLTHGPLAFLPMAEPHQCGVVWSTAPAHAGELLALDDAAFRQTLAEAFQHTLGAVTGVGVRQGFPLQRAQAQRYCAERVALVGDAAHCIHPLAGLGANLGLLDVASLFQLVRSAATKGRDPGGSALLHKYERWRKGENYMVMMTLEGLKYLFESQLLPIPWLRNAGMELFDSSRILKNFTMSRATGLDGDLPDIARHG